MAQKETQYEEISNTKYENNLYEVMVEPERIPETDAETGNYEVNIWYKEGGYWETYYGKGGLIKDVTLTFDEAIEQLEKYIEEENEHIQGIINEPETTVIFRKFTGKEFEGFNPEIIAFFTEQNWTSGDCNQGMVMSYMIVGEHGEADYYGLLSDTKLATPEEYADTKKVLENLGYKLVVKKKWSRRGNK
jgi:hypothetical protein